MITATITVTFLEDTDYAASIDEIVDAITAEVDGLTLWIEGEDEEGEDVSARYDLEVQDVTVSTPDRPVEVEEAALVAVS